MPAASTPWAAGVLAGRGRALVEAASGQLLEMNEAAVVPLAVLPVAGHRLSHEVRAGLLRLKRRDA